MLLLAAAVAYSRLLAGSGDDWAAAVAVDAAGTAYIAGNTGSPDFPITAGVRPDGPLAVYSRGALAMPEVKGAFDVFAVAGTRDAQTLYAAASNGIYRSDDGGDTWVRTTAAFGAGAIAVASADAAYAASKQTIYTTEDGGRTWTPHGVNGTVVQLLASGPALAYAVTMNPYLTYRTIDGGATWTRLDTPAATPRSLALDPNDPNALYLGYVDGLFKSTDHGDTWATLFTGPIGADQPGVVAVAQDILYVGLQKSTDGGRSFTATSRPLTCCPATMAIDPATRTVYAATRHEVYSSTDAGVTWNPIGPSRDVHSIYAAPGRLFIAGMTPPRAFVAKLDPLGNVLFTRGLEQANARAVALDPAGNIYVAGIGYVVKLSPDGARVLYSVSLATQSTMALAVDGGGNAYVTGAIDERREEFPVTAGAFQTRLPDRCTRSQEGLGFFSPYSPFHTFVAKLDGTGAVAYSTLLTGPCGSSPSAIAVDTGGRAFVAGSTTSDQFPVTGNAFQPKFPGQATSGFLAVLSADGSRLAYSTYLGGGFYGSATAVTLDADGNVYVAGSAGLTPTPGTYRNSPRSACPLVINIAPAPVSLASDPFIVKLKPDSAATPLVVKPGLGCDILTSSIALDPGGSILIAGTTNSLDLPTMAPLAAAGTGYGFLSRFSPDGTRLSFSTYLDSANKMAVDGRGGVYVAGGTSFAGPEKFASTPFYDDRLLSAFALKLDLSATTAVTLDAVLHFKPPVVADGSAGIAPGELIRITGRGLGPGARVLFGDLPATVLSIEPQEIVCLAPFDIENPTTIEIERNGQKSNSVKAGVAPVAFVDALAVANQDSSANSAANPAHPGEVLVLYVTGLGRTDPPSQDGAINREPLPKLQRPPERASIFRLDAAIEYAGPAPGQLAGVYQINLRIPQDQYPGGPVGVRVDNSILTSAYIK